MIIDWYVFCFCFVAIVVGIVFVWCVTHTNTSVLTHTHLLTITNGHIEQLLNWFYCCSHFYCCVHWLFCFAFNQIKHRFEPAIWFSFFVCFIIHVEFSQNSMSMWFAVFIFRIEKKKSIWKSICGFSFLIWILFLKKLTKKINEIPIKCCYRSFTTKTNRTLIVLNYCNEFKHRNLKIVYFNCHLSCIDSQ